METFEAAAHIDKARLFEGAKAVQEGGVEPFAGRVGDDELVFFDETEGLGGVEAVVVEVAGGAALLKREAGERIVFDEVDPGRLAGQSEADRADACVEFEDFLFRGGPRIDRVEHPLEKRKVRLGKGARMESDGDAVQGLMEKRFSGDLQPRAAENAVGLGRVEVKPKGVP